MPLKTEGMGYSTAFLLVDAREKSTWVIRLYYGDQGEPLVKLKTAKYIINNLFIKICQSKYSCQIEALDVPNNSTLYCSALYSLV